MELFVEIAITIALLSVAFVGCATVYLAYAMAEEDMEDD